MILLQEAVWSAANCFLRHVTVPRGVIRLFAATKGRELVALDLERDKGLEGVQGRLIVCVPFA